MPIQVICIGNLRTKSTHKRIFDVASAALDTATVLPSQLARTFRQLDTELDKLVTNAQPAPANS